MFDYMAHAGEDHDTVVAAATHTTFTEWYIAIPLFLATLLLVLVVTYRLCHGSINATYGIGLAGLIAGGVLAYSTIPALSIVCLVLGFSMTLLQVLFSLTAKK